MHGSTNVAVIWISKSDLDLSLNRSIFNGRPTNKDDRTTTGSRRYDYMEVIGRAKQDARAESNAGSSYRGITIHLKHSDPLIRDSIY